MDFKSSTSNEINTFSNFENQFFDPDERIDINQNQDNNEKSEYDIDKRVETYENEHEVKGGSYSEVKKNSNGETHEVHHMPADVSSYLDRTDGPAIKMEKEDHKQTASYGNSNDAREYRAIQKELIDNGKFRDAMQMDIDDIQEKFGSKYDEAISEMIEYVDKLESEGKI